MKKMLTMTAIVASLALLFGNSLQATEWRILDTEQNGETGATFEDPLLVPPTLGMTRWETEGVNGASNQRIYGQGVGPDYACYGLSYPSPNLPTCASAMKPVIWAPGIVMYSGVVNDDGSVLDLSWTGQAGTSAATRGDLFNSTILSGSYDQTGAATGTDPGIPGYDTDGFACWNRPGSVYSFGADFCGNGTGGAGPGGTPQTIANRILTDGLGPNGVVDNMDGTITITLTDSTYTDCLADVNCTPGSSSSNVRAVWRVNAEISGITVPDLTGVPADAAEDILVDLGLTVGTVNGGQSNDVEKGTVANQNPAAGTTVDLGTAVNMIVSTGAVQDFLPGGTESLDPWTLLLLLGLPFLRRFRTGK
jgi:hypothetical protein